MSGPRVRVRFSKHGKVRFTSHRDVARIWERALRRARVPVAYSEGFSPRPRIAFGLALPTGYSSDAEYLDVEVDPAWAASIDNSVLVGALTESLPAGMTATAVAEVASGELSLQHAVTSCTWRIDTTGTDARTASEAVARAMDSRELLVERERKGRRSINDIRPAVHTVEVHPTVTDGVGLTDGASITDSACIADSVGHPDGTGFTDGVSLTAELATQPQAVRPTELLASLHPPLKLLRACRLHQWITTDAGERREPLAVAEMSVAGAGVDS